MKINNIIKGALLGVLAMGSVSCADFLHRPLEDGYNADIFYKTDEQVEMGVNFLYNSPWYDFERAFFKVGEVMSGNMYTNAPAYQNFTLNGSDGDLINMSYSLWAVNGQANTVISNILKSEGPSQAAKNKAIGEALTLKAMAYFYMVRTFGEVPIVHDNKEILDAGTYNDLYKVTKENVYEYIIVTLEKAMELLPKQTSGWTGRIDYYAAEGLLSKVYLTKAGVSGNLKTEDLQKAAAYAEDVILNSGRTLTPVYSDIFRLKPDTYNQTGEHLIAWMWDAEQGNWTAQNSLQSEFALKGFSGISDDEWGSWTSPSYDLALAFGADPLAAPDTRGEDKEADTRRKATMMMAGDVYSYFWQDRGGFDLLRYMYSEDEEYAPVSIGGFTGPCGTQCVKHLYGSKEDHASAVGYESTKMSYELPTPILRLADVYLVCAEAYLLTGNDAKALEYVNKVRARAYNEKVDPNDGALTSVTFDDIWKERRLELAGEGDRWYDYVRLAYYDVNKAMDDLRSQKRNSIYSYDEACKNYWYTGCGGSRDKKPDDLTNFNPANAKWELEFGTEVQVRYNSDTAGPNVNESIFTLPLPTEDVVFNPNLLEPAQEVDVRATYVYNF